MIVVDVGSATHGRNSIAILARMFKPQCIWAIDPHPYNEGPAYIEDIKDTLIIRRFEAAWTRGGTISWHDEGSGSHVGGRKRVKCCHLAELVEGINPPVIVKFDVEGAEFILLEDFIHRGTDMHVQKILVEWHMDAPDAAIRRAVIEKKIQCPLEEWEW